MDTTNRGHGKEGLGIFGGPNNQQLGTAGNANG